MVCRNGKAYYFSATKGRQIASERFDPRHKQLLKG